jgi:flagellar assembly protein FliH
MLKDGPKKSGRFIKKDSSVLKKVSLESFDFAEISSTPAIEQDNSRRTIVHSKYHSDEELSIVKAPRKFEDDLMHPDNRRPIIFPVDFTNDWEREKKLRKDRSLRQDEDDDFSYSESYEAAEESGYDLTERQPEPPADKATASNRNNPEEEESEITRLHTPLKIAGPQIRDFSKDSVDDKLGSHLSMGAVPQGSQAPLNLEEALSPRPQVPTQAPAPAAEFIPNSSQQAAEHVTDPEQDAAEAYKQRIAQEKVDQEKIQALYEEAKARGFQDGFRAGEEKGELQVRQNASALFQKVQSLVESFMDLKSTVLNNVQENFYTISQAVAEALLKREFSIRPDAFAAIVRQAIADAVAPNEFKIKVNPAMAERLKKISDKDFLRHIVKDASVDDGDFKIESELSVIDVNMTKLVSDLIEQADINIFDDAEKAG